LNVSKRISSMMKSMWLLQYNLERRRPKRVLSLLRQRYYRAAFDLLVLRAEQDESLKELAQWWHDIYLADDDERSQMISKLGNDNKKRKRKRKTNSEKSSK
jgi:poly(A) polymerase